MTTPNQAPEAPNSGQWPPRVFNEIYVMPDGHYGVHDDYKKRKRIIFEYVSLLEHQHQMDRHAARISDLEKQLAEAEIRAAEKDKEIGNLQCQISEVIQFHKQRNKEWEVRYNLLNESNDKTGRREKFLEERLAVAEKALDYIQFMNSAWVDHVGGTWMHQSVAREALATLRAQGVREPEDKIRGEG